MIGAHDAPQVAPLFRLQFEPVQDAWVLLYPEGMVKLNTPAAEILRRCDGQRSVAAIVEELETTFSRRGLDGDVRAFLEQARGRGWLRGGT
jgi:pyrroloquinoline quinone biosynthesis protein D